MVAVFAVPLEEFAARWLRSRDVGFGAIVERSVVLTVLFLIPSMYNYPGGYALLRMNVGLGRRL